MSSGSWGHVTPWPGMSMVRNSTRGPRGQAAGTTRPMAQVAQARRPQPRERDPSTRDALGHEPYQRIAVDLCAAIACGALRPGGHLPTVEEPCAGRGRSSRERSPRWPRRTRCRHRQDVEPLDDWACASASTAAGASRRRPRTELSCASCGVGRRCRWGLSTPPERRPPSGASLSS